MPHLTPLSAGLPTDFQALDAGTATARGGLCAVPLRAYKRVTFDGTVSP